MSFVYQTAKEKTKLFTTYQTKDEDFNIVLLKFLQYITETIAILPLVEEDHIFGNQAVDKIFELLEANDECKKRNEEFISIIKNLKIKSTTNQVVSQAFLNLSSILDKNNSFFDKTFPDIKKITIANKIEFFNGILKQHLFEIVKVKPWTRWSLFIQVKNERKKIIKRERKIAQEEGLTGPEHHPVFAPSKRKRVENSSNASDEKPTFLQLSRGLSKKA